MMGSEKKSDRTESRVRLAFHDFFVDVLGALVPGILFSIAVLLALAPPIQAFVIASSPAAGGTPISTGLDRLLAATKGTPNMIWIGVLVTGLLICYVLGHLFYRQDPKAADRKSYAVISKNHPTPTELDELRSTMKGQPNNTNDLQEEWLRRNFACSNGDECEFPYPYLGDYLKQRGHEHLLPLVPWNDKRNWRSKTYINQLKVRLAWHYAGKCRPIVRNEAHVRLATSTWYVLRALRWFGAIAICVVILSFVVAAARGHFESYWNNISWHIPAVLSPVLVLSVAELCRHMIERFIHYQRLREVFYVLELAYTAFRDNTSSLESPKISLRTWAQDEGAEETKAGTGKSHA